MRNAAARSARCLAGLLVSAAITGPAAPAVAADATNFASFMLRHDETISEGAAFDTYVDENPGETQASPLLITGIVSGQYGDHELTVVAVSDSEFGTSVSLKTRITHAFDVRGEQPNHHIWEAFTSDATARAGIDDVLALGNLPVSLVVMKLYWDVHGYEEADAAFSASQGPIVVLDANVRLDVTIGGCGPPSVHESVEQKLVAAKGLLEEPLDGKTVRLEDRVAIKINCIVRPEPVTVNAVLQTDSHTHMLNDGIERNLSLTGRHLAYFEDSADLIGILFEDEDGNVLPNVQVQSSNGYTYPVLTSPPPELVPEKTLLSPTRVPSNDMGSFSDEVLPEKMIDHSGLDKEFTSGETDFDVYFDLEPEPFGDGYYANNWQSEVALTLPLMGTLDFDFGNAYRFDRLAFWNRTLEDIRISFALDPDGPWEPAGSFTLENQISSGFVYRAEVVELDRVYEGQYLRVDVDSVYPISPLDTFGYAMVGEIAASAGPVTVGLPEPGTGAVGAAAVLALLLLRKRQRVSVGTKPR